MPAHTSGWLSQDVHHAELDEKANVVELQGPEALICAV